MKNLLKIGSALLLITSIWSTTGQAYYPGYYPGGYSSLGQYCGYGYAPCAPGLYCANSGYDTLGVCRPQGGSYPGWGYHPGWGHHGGHGGWHGGGHHGGGHHGGHGGHR